MCPAKAYKPSVLPPFIFYCSACHHQLVLEQKYTENITPTHLPPLKLSELPLCGVELMQCAGRLLVHSHLETPSIRAGSRGAGRLRFIR
jgi:hypothetical protein